MVTIALFEDDKVWQERLISSIGKALQEPFQVEVFSSGDEFLTQRKHAEKEYQIIFMDIELGDASGIQIAKKMNDYMPDAQIIYVTQYMEYVSSVYESQHIYFIHKKEIDQYLSRAMEIALEKIRKIDSRYLSFSWNKETYKILQKEIVYMERILRTTKIHTRTAVFSTSEKLSELLKRLDKGFVLCHRSYLVNLNAVVRIEKDRVSLKPDQSVPVSRSRYHDLKQQFNLWIAG